MATECACCCRDEVTEQELYGKLDTVIADHVGKPGALIPVLQIAQTMFGYLPKAVIHRISEGLNEPLSKVHGVVTFYSFFSQVPRGKYLVRVCLGTACYVRNGKDVLAALRKELGIEVGGTTPDRLFSLAVGRCFGACGLAPAIMVNDDVHQRVKPSRITEILDQYRRAEEKA